MPGGFAVPGVRLLGEQWLIVDGGAKFFGQRFERLMAAHPVGGVEHVGAEREQHSNERLGLSAAVLVQWPLSVIALVPRLAARRPMPHDQHRLGIYGLFGEAAQHFSIVRILQMLDRLGNGQPLELVDFAFGLKSPSTLRAAQYRTFLMPCSTG